MNATATNARTASTLTGRRPAAKHPITEDRYRTVGAIVDGTQSTHFGDYAAKVGARAAVANAGLLLKRGAEDEKTMAVIEAAAVAANNLSRTVGLHVHNVLFAYARWHAAGAVGSFQRPRLPAELRREVTHDLPVGRYLTKLLKDFRHALKAYRVEIFEVSYEVFNEELRYTGRIDLVAEAFIGGRMRHLAIDFTTAKEYPAIPEKLAALRRATRTFTSDGQPIDAHDTESGAVLQFLDDGCHLSRIPDGDDQEAWDRFALAEQLYSKRSGQPRRPGLEVYPPKKDGTQPPVKLSDLDGRGYGRVIAPLIEAGCHDTHAAQARFESGLRVPGIGPKIQPHFEKLVADYGRQKVAA